MGPYGGRLVRGSRHRLHAQAGAVQPAQAPAPGGVDDVVHVGKARPPAELALGERGDGGGGVEIARAALADADLYGPIQAPAGRVDDLADGEAVGGGPASASGSPGGSA